MTTKQAHDKYRKSDRGRAKNLAAVQRYRQTEKGKATVRRVRQKARLAKKPPVPKTTDEEAEAFASYFDTP